MVWIFRERKDSRDSSINPGRCTLKFIAGRTGDDAYVRAYSLAATPLLYYSLFRQTVDIKSLGGGMWNVDVNYGPLEPPTSVGEYSYQFDTTGNVAKRTNFLGTPTSYAREGETRSQRRHQRQRQRRRGRRRGCAGVQVDRDAHVSRDRG
jgi:hypothetical protein